MALTISERLKLCGDMKISPKTKPRSTVHLDELGEADPCCDDTVEQHQISSRVPEGEPTPVEVVLRPQKNKTSRPPEPARRRKHLVI